MQRDVRWGKILCEVEEILQVIIVSNLETYRPNHLHALWRNRGRRPSYPPRSQSPPILFREVGETDLVDPCRNVWIIDYPWKYPTSLHLNSRSTVLEE